MMSFIDRIPLMYLVIFTLFLGLAPFVPEPHIWEKLKMLAAGTLNRPLDIFDLFWHSWPIALLLVKLYRMNMIQP